MSRISVFNQTSKFKKGGRKRLHNFTPFQTFSPSEVWYHTLHQALHLQPVPWPEHLGTYTSQPALTSLPKGPPQAPLTKGATWHCPEGLKVGVLGVPRGLKGDRPGAPARTNHQRCARSTMHQGPKGCDGEGSVRGDRWGQCHLGPHNHQAGLWALVLGAHLSALRACFGEGSARAWALV